MLTLLLRAIQNLTRSGTIKSIEQAYQLAKRELGEKFNAAKKQIDDAFNQGKREQTLDKRTKDIKKTEEEGIAANQQFKKTQSELKKQLDKLNDDTGIKSLETEIDEDSIMGQINKSKNKLEEAANKLEKLQKEKDEFLRPRTDEEIAEKFGKKRFFKGVEIKDPTFDETLPFDNDAEKLAEIKMSNEAYDMEKARGTEPKTTKKGFSKTPITDRLSKAVEEAKQQIKEIGSLSDADMQKKQIQDALRALRDRRIYEMGSGIEGDVRTALRQFVKKEVKEGRLDIPDAYEKKMILEDRQGGVDPIDVFRKAYGEDALIAVDDVFEQYGGRLTGPTYRDIEENFRKLFKMNRGFYDMADLPVPKAKYEFEPGLRSVDSVEEELMKQYRQLDDLDRFNVKDRKPNAEGGIMRTSYAYGSGLKLAVLLARKGKTLKEEIRKMIDNVFLSGDSKYDADVVLDNVLEDLNIDRDAVDGFDISKAYGEAYDMLRAKIGLASKKVPGSKTPESSTQVFKDSEGGIKGITMGGDKDFQKAMSEAMEEGMRESENMKRLGLDPTNIEDAFKYDEMKKAGQLEKNVTGSADLSPAEELRKEFPGITDEMIESILTDNNPQRIAEVKQTMREALTMLDKGMGMDEIMEIFTKTKRTKQATGGRVRAASGGLARILNL